MKTIVKKLAIDMGNSNIKFVGEENGELKCRIVRSLATTDAVDTNHIVKHAGKTLNFGIGESLVKADKTDREHIKETILLGVYETYGPNEIVVEIDLALGLPLDLYKSSKKADFEDKVKLLTNVILDGTVNGEPVLVKVKSIKICAEGYSAFINLSSTIDKSVPNLIVDVGYGTTDIIGVSFNQNTSKWQIDDNMTYNKGLYDVYDAIMKEFLDKEKVNLTKVENVEQRFLNSPIVLTKTGEVDIHKYLYSAEPVMNDIFNRIEKKFTDMQTRKIYLVGGGADLSDKLTKNLVHKQLSNKSTSLFANAVGYLMQIK